MITIYRSGRNGLETIEEYEGGSWVHTVNPTPQEIDALVARFAIPLDFLTDPLDVDERARVEREEGNTFILLRTTRREDPEACKKAAFSMPISTNAACMPGRTRLILPL